MTPTDQTTTDCPNCNGKGREQRIGDAGPNSLCNRCGGRGYVIGALRPVRDDDLASAFALGCSVGTSGEMTDEQEQKYARLFPESATAQLVRLKQDAPARSGDGATVPSKQDVLGAAVLFANAAHRCYLQGDYHDDDGECEHALQHLYSLIDRLPIPDAAAPDPGTDAAAGGQDG